MAVIRTAIIHAEGDEVEPFEIIVGNWILGEDFFAYRYPADILGPEPDNPTGRFVQRALSALLSASKPEFGVSLRRRRARCDAEPDARRHLADPPGHARMSECHQEKGHAHS
jgi:hypothetical protein